jgi:hypothetical protein
MPNLLSDPPTWLYGLLVLLVVVPLLAAFFFPENRPQSRDSQKKTAVRRKWFFIIAGLGLLLLIGLALCDYFFESDREQIKRKLNEMSEDVRNRNLTRLFDNISDSFHVQNSGKTELRRRAEEALQGGQVTEVKISNLEIPSVESGAKSATSEFLVKIEGAFTGLYRCRAVFAKDPDGQWRLQSFQIFNPAGESNQPITIPGL